MQEEFQIGAVEWTKNLVNCVSLTGYLTDPLTLSDTSYGPLAKGSLRVSNGKNKNSMW